MGANGNRSVRVVRDPFAHNMLLVRVSLHRVHVFFLVVPASRTLGFFCIVNNELDGLVEAARRATKVMEKYPGLNRLTHW